MSIVINIILILASIVLIIAVLMQEGNKQGLGAIGGAAETFMGKSKAKGAEGKLLLITKITAAVFVVLAIFATWWNLRSFAVSYYDENGNQFYPMLGSSQAGDDVYQSWIANAAEQGVDEKDAVKNLTSSYSSYQRGEAISYASVPAKTGYTGTWALAEKKDGKWVKTDGALPEKMGSSSIAVISDYAINSYTIGVVNPGEEAEAAFTFTGEYDTAIDYSTYTAPEAQVGETLFYSTTENAADEDIIWFRKLPENVPAADVTYYADFAKGNFVEYYVPEITTAEDGTVQISEDYKEYYPLELSYEYNLYLSALQSSYLYDYEHAYEHFVEELQEEDKDYYRVFAKEGIELGTANINIAVPDAPDGMVGVWETEDGKEISGTMGSERLKLYAKYYPAGTVKLVEVAPEGVDEYEPADEITLTGKVGAEIKEEQLPAKEGYTVEWADGNAPTVFGEEEATYSYSFVAVEETEEEEQSEEAPETEEEQQPESDDTASDSEDTDKE